jgi:hypothetical protein
MIDGQMVSLVTGCMNRLPSLLSALPSWLAVREIDELVIVDWGSKPPVRDVVWGYGQEVEGISLRTSDPRVRFYRVPDAREWRFSACANLGIAQATGERILRVDADVQLASAILDDLDLASGDFWTGNWTNARDDNERHLNGTIYAYKAAFELVGGYSERLLGYGYDDEDLYARLWQAGFGRRFIDHDLMRHLPHDDESRLAHAPDPPERYDDVSILVPRLATETVRQRLERANAYNRKMASRHPWSHDDRQAVWDIRQEDAYYWICREAT